MQQLFFIQGLKTSASSFNCKTFFQVKGVNEGYEQPPATEISVMIYFTPAFRLAFSDPIHRIKLQVSYANLVFSECEIPIKLYIYCIKEMEGFVEKCNGDQRLDDFNFAKKNLLNTADIGILMTGTPSTKYNGYANIGPPIGKYLSSILGKYHPPIAWVYPSDDLTFLHEVGHIFGCRHDPDTLKNGGWLEQYGRLIDILMRESN